MFRRDDDVAAEKIENAVAYDDPNNVSALQRCFGQTPTVDH
jgi:hypothetical protein